MFKIIRLFIFKYTCKWYFRMFYFFEIFIISISSCVNIYILYCKIVLVIGFVSLSNWDEWSIFKILCIVIFTYCHNMGDVPVFVVGTVNSRVYCFVHIFTCYSVYLTSPKSLYSIYDLWSVKLRVLDFS